MPVPLYDHHARQPGSATTERQFVDNELTSRTVPSYVSDLWQLQTFADLFQYIY